MTRATPLSGMVGRPKANTANTQDMTLALAVPKIFHGVWNSKIGRIAPDHAYLGDSWSSED